MEIQLETERLILRNINADTDFKSWAEMMADAQTITYLWNNTPYNAEAAWQNMVMNIGHWHARGYGFFSVIDKRSGEWVGRVGPYNPHGWPEPEIGWAIHPNHTRKGYGYEAAKACIGYVFDTLGWEKLTHAIVKGNIPSVKLAEKLGSRFLYKIEDEESGRTRLVYGQTKKKL